MELGVLRPRILSVRRSGPRQATKLPLQAVPSLGLRSQPHVPPAFSKVKGCHSTPPTTALLQRRTTRHVAARAMGDDAEPYTAFPFHDSDYHKVTFVPPPYGPMKLYEDSKGGSFNGVLVFKREGDAMSSDELTVLEVFVAGDTAFNTWSQLTHQAHERPMVHELMWTLLERARGGDGARWSLLRVGIVELRSDVYIGRLWFGNPETGEVMWDCDCRPSDGCFLSLKAQCPFFVHRRVWDIACLPIRDSSVYKLVATSAYTSVSAPSSTSSATATQDGADGSATDAAAAAGVGGEASAKKAIAQFSVVSELAQIRPDDPEPIKLLKRAMSVAVSEEDYPEAIRLRDHQWMQMYRDIQVARKLGRYGEAQKLEDELLRQISIISDSRSTH